MGFQVYRSQEPSTISLGGGATSTSGGNSTMEVVASCRILDCSEQTDSGSRLESVVFYRRHYPRTGSIPVKVDSLIQQNNLPVLGAHR